MSENDREINDPFDTTLKDISLDEAETEQEVEHAVGKRFNSLCVEAINEGVDPMVVAQTIHDTASSLWTDDAWVRVKNYPNPTYDIDNLDWDEPQTSLNRFVMGVCKEAQNNGIVVHDTTQELHDLSEGLKITLYTTSLREQYQEDIENSVRDRSGNKIDWIDEDHPLK